MHANPSQAASDPLPAPLSPSLAELPAEASVTVQVPQDNPLPVVGHAAADESEKPRQKKKRRRPTHKKKVVRSPAPAGDDAEEPQDATSAHGNVIIAPHLILLLFEQHCRPIDHVAGYEFLKPCPDYLRGPADPRAALAELVRDCGEESVMNAGLIRRADPGQWDPHPALLSGEPFLVLHDEDMRPLDLVIEAGSLRTSRPALLPLLQDAQTRRAMIEHRILVLVRNLEDLVLCRSAGLAAALLRELPELTVAELDEFAAGLRLSDPASQDENENEEVPPLDENDPDWLYGGRTEIKSDIRADIRVFDFSVAARQLDPSPLGLEVFNHLDALASSKYIEISDELLCDLDFCVPDADALRALELFASQGDADRYANCLKRICEEGAVSGAGYPARIGVADRKSAERKSAEPELAWSAANTLLSSGRENPFWQTYRASGEDKRAEMLDRIRRAHDKECIQWHCEEASAIDNPIERLLYDQLVSAMCEVFEHRFVRQKHRMTRADNDRSEGNIQQLEKLDAQLMKLGKQLTSAINQVCKWQNHKASSFRADRLLQLRMARAQNAAKEGGS